MILLYKQIPPNGFQAVSTLQILDLSGNPSLLPERPAFSSMPHLQELYLRWVSLKMWLYLRARMCVCACNNVYLHFCTCKIIFIVILCSTYFCINLTDMFNCMRYHLIYWAYDNCESLTWAEMLYNQSQRYYVCFWTKNILHMKLLVY